MSNLTWNCRSIEQCPACHSTWSSGPVVHKLRNTNTTKRRSVASPCKTYCGTTWLSRTRSSIWPLTSTRQSVHPTLNLFTCFQHQERSSYVWMSISHQQGVQERLRRSAHRGRPDGVPFYLYLLLKCWETVALLYETVRQGAEFNNVEPGGARNWHREPRCGGRVIWPDCLYVPETFLFSKTSRPALEPTQLQPPVQWLQRPFLGDEATRAQSCSPHLVLTSKIRGVVRRALSCRRGAQTTLH
jgi:hypothetical protein